MGRLASTFRRAVAAHREAMAHLAAARQAADPGPAAIGTTPELRDVTERLADIAAEVAPGWQGAVLVGGGVLAGGAGGPAGPPPPFGATSPTGRMPVRVGVAHATEDTAFPALVPLLGGAHLALDTDAREPAVGALLRSLVVRLLGAASAGTVHVLAADRAALGATFLPLRRLIEAGAISEPATSDDEVRTLLDEAERHVRTAQSGAAPWLVVAAASAPEGRTELARLAALTHAAPAARVCVLVAGYPPRPYGVEPPALGGTTRIRVNGAVGWLGDPPADPFSTSGAGLAAPVRFDGDPPSTVVDRLADHLAERHRRAATFAFADLVPVEPWTGSSVDGLRTVVGRAGRSPVVLAFDDATPHWLVGGRTGSGKTVLLLDVLYGLAARYSPDELALYLLDFKEGISFTEFVPTRHDPSWIPHAQAVGIESDREFGVAVLRELRREMNRRAATLKQHGATKLSDLRRGQSDVAMPRIVTVIDEFHVLFQGNDALARETTALLEELARKGRSYGIHLVLASQTVSGVEALYGKTDSIFGQFPLRIALPGGSGVLDVLNDAAASLALGTAVVNPAGGAAGANTIVRFPDAHGAAAEVTALRRSMWEARTPGSHPPAIFKGYEAAHVEDDPVFGRLTVGGRRPAALVGRNVDVGLSTASFPLDAAPGRHLAVVGTSAVGADVLHAAAVSLGRQHAPGSARFLIAPLVALGDEVADETAAALRSAGHDVSVLDAAGLRAELAGWQSRGPAYLVVFGVDSASAALAVRDPDTFRSGQDDLVTLLRQGPAFGVHLLGWWRGLRRLADDIGGTGNREDIACLVALNVPGSDLGLFLGQHDLAYAPRANRALLLDRHDQRVSLIVPFVRPGRVVDEVA